MTPEQLIEEGRRLQRECILLRPIGSGPVAAVWHGRPSRGPSGHRSWLTVDSRVIPGLPSSVDRYLSVFTDGQDDLGGRVEFSPSWPDRPGAKLYAHAASVLPPIDAVFARGSEAVGEWLRAHDWERTERYNDNFTDAAMVREYERVWTSEYPLFLDSDIYAVLGGWHFPGADDDWHDLIDDHLMVLTIRDAEPWIEAWRTRTGQFKVIQRIT